MGSQIPEIDFERLQAEIDEEVRRRRASGELPPGLERELDEVFARFSPAGDTSGGFTEAIEQADVQSYIHADVPVAAARPGVSILKQVLKRLFGWYVRFVAQQTTAFGAAIVRAVRLLAERVSALEAVVPAADDALDSEVRRATTDGALEPWADEVLQAVRGVAGRVLHAECGDGTLLGVLQSGGVDAYGVDPDDGEVATAARAGYDVRPEGALDHLRSLPDGFLGGLVLSGCVDRQPLPVLRDLVAAARAKLRPGAPLAIVGTSPAAWARTQSPVVIDLSPGRPLHPQTWEHLLGASGFTEVSVSAGPADRTLQPVDPAAPGADVLNENLRRLNDTLFGPESHLVVARAPGAD